MGRGPVESTFGDCRRSFPQPCPHPGGMQEWAVRNRVSKEHCELKAIFQLQSVRATIVAPGLYLSLKRPVNPSWGETCAALSDICPLGRFNWTWGAHLPSSSAPCKRLRCSWLWKPHNHNKCICWKKLNNNRCPSEHSMTVKGIYICE